jgi:hypothetical protein
MILTILISVFFFQQAQCSDEPRDRSRPISMRTGFSRPLNLSFEEARDFFARRISTQILPQIRPLLPENIAALAPANLVNELAIHNQTPEGVLGGYFVRLGSSLLNEHSLDEEVRRTLAYSSFLRAGNYYLYSVRNLPPSVEHIDQLVSAAQCFHWSMIRCPSPRNRALLYTICRLNLENAQRQVANLPLEEDRVQWSETIRARTVSLRQALLAFSRQ